LPGDCWTSKEVDRVFELRKNAFEARRKLNMDDCFHVPVKLELIIYHSNITRIKSSHDYVGDLDSIIAGVCESLRPADKQVISVPKFNGYEEFGPRISLILEDDAQVIEIAANKIQSNTPYYSVIIEEK
jgi:Holliday junction resolvase RusA-like endonuclease